MKKFLILIVLTIVLIFQVNDTTFAEPYRPGNMGILNDYGSLGHIVGNAMKWDYALIFKIRKHGDAYRALADIEKTISDHSAWQDGEDKLVAMGAIDGCIIVSIITKTKKQKLYSSYARASRYTNLCKIYPFNWWQTEEWEALTIDGSIRLSKICE